MGHNLRDGLHRRRREGSWSLDHGGNARRDDLHYSGLTLCGSLRTRAIRDRDVYHVHAFSNQLARLACISIVQPRLTLRGLYHSGVKGIWRHVP